jgi:hypothetical protein
MVNCPQCGEEVDPRLHIHTPPDFFAAGKKATERVEDRWPVVALTEGEVFRLKGWLGETAKGVQEYHPESAPNVLSPDEARLIVDNLSAVQDRFEDLMPLFRRLSTWAEGEEAK